MTSARFIELSSGDATEASSWLPNLDFGVLEESESSCCPRYTIVPLVEASSRELDTLLLDCRQPTNKHISVYKMQIISSKLHWKPTTVLWLPENDGFSALGGRTTVPVPTGDISSSSSWRDSRELTETSDENWLVVAKVLFWVVWFKGTSNFLPLIWGGLTELLTVPVLVDPPMLKSHPAFLRVKGKQRPISQRFMAQPMVNKYISGQQL